MKNKFNQLFALLLVFLSAQAYSNPINEINFIGLNNTSERILLKEININVGDEYSDASSNKIIESLFKTGLFSDISVTNIQGSLSITLVENPTIKFFDVTLETDSGFRSWLKGEKMFLSEELIQQDLDDNNLSVGSAYSESKLDNFILLLESKYSSSGYYNVKINTNITVDSQNRAGVDLTINQGERAKIESFRITGSENLSEEELLKLFKIGEADMAFINYFTNKDLFTESEFSRGIDLMSNKYFDLGYLDFKISNIDTEIDTNKEKISINIQISEGIQYKIGKISFEGQLDPYSLSELEGSILMSDGDIFNRNLVIENIQKLTDMFADKGFAFINVNPITSEFLDKVNITFEISSNQKVYINRINISGNTRTQDSVIRREIGISEGSLYSRNALKNSLRKLRRLGYFSDVQISTAKVDKMPDKIDINFIVEETQTGSLSFSMSHNSKYGISFGAGIEEKNIFGSGNTLNAEFRLSKSFNKLSLYFMNPNYNDEGHSVSLGVFKSEINDDDIAVNSYEIDTSGFSFGYGIPLNDNTRLNSELVYSKNTIKCSELFSGVGYEPSQCLAKNKDELVANLAWSKDTLNNYVYPTEGETNSISSSISLPGSDYKYYNLNAGFSNYSPLSSSTTIKLSGNLNLSSGFSGEELPFYKRHFGGGSGSVRGFGNKTLGPEYPNGKARGGELSILGSAQIITPAFLFENNEKMRMSAFIDAGNIFENSSKINLGDIRMSTGLGFTYMSPIGPIGAFVATPILKKDGDTTEEFGFLLGTGF